MLKFRYICFVALTAVALLLPTEAFAQLDAASIARAQRQGQDIGVGSTLPGMEGMTDEDGEAMEGEQADSTETKKRRPKRPLESYYFNDTVRALPNWKWHVDRDYNLVSIGGNLWGDMPLWGVWSVFVGVCAVAAIFMFAMMKKLEDATK